MTMTGYQDKFEKLYEEEELKERMRLVSAYKENEEVLAKAMKFIHPSIMEKLRNYLRIPPEEHKAKERKCDDTIAKIITRAAHKTSPFSTLTHVGAGFIEENKDSNCTFEYKYTTITKFNIVYALRIYEKVVLLPEIIEQSTYRFADTLVYLREKFYWTVLKDDPKKRKKVYKTMDELITVKANTILESIYRNFQGKKEFTYKELQEFLITMGMSAEEAKSLLITLVNRQFLSNVQFLDQNSDDIIGDFIAILEKYTNSEKIERLMVGLREIHQKIEVFDR